MRILVAVFVLFVSLVIAMAIAAAGDMSRVAIVGSFASLVAGFGCLGVARRSNAPLGPLYFTLAVCCIIAIAMLAGLGWPPARADFGVWIVLILEIVVAVAIVIRWRGRPRFAAYLLVLPALNALWGLARLLFVVPRDTTDSWGPSATIAYFIAATMAAGWIVAPWHAWAASRGAETKS